VTTSARFPELLGVGRSLLKADQALVPHSIWSGSFTLCKVRGIGGLGRTLLGGIAAAYSRNMPGIGPKLRMSFDMLADISGILWAARQACGATVVAESAKTPL
jgi:hypothetical protein